MFGSFWHFQLANRLWCCCSCLFIDFGFLDLILFNVISILHWNRFSTLCCNHWLRQSSSINVVDQRFIHVLLQLFCCWFCKIGKRYMMVKYDLGTDKNLTSHTYNEGSRSQIFWSNKKWMRAIASLSISSFKSIYFRLFFFISFNWIYSIFDQCSWNRSLDKL